MNWDLIEGQWKQARGAVRQRWGLLTDDDLDRIAGKQDRLIGRIQERYGITKDEARGEVESWRYPARPETAEERERDERERKAG